MTDVQTPDAPGPEDPPEREPNSVPYRWTDIDGGAAGKFDGLTVNRPQPAVPRLLPLGPPPEPSAAARLPPASAAAGQPEIRISLWGGPGSGKTAFLAALPQAAEQARHNPLNGIWTMTAIDEFTEAYQERELSFLVDSKQFPSGTTGLQSGLKWRLQGSIGGTPLSSRPKWLRKRSADSEQIQFSLRVPDVNGELFGKENAETAAQGVTRADLLDELAASDGLLYLFDPEPEDADHPQFRYLNGMLNSLRRQMQESGDDRDRYLPQHLAVCVTKFDAPEVYKAALAARLVSQDAQGQPCVASGRPAELFFDLLCDKLETSGKLVNDKLRSNFAADRIRFFVTTAVGFRRGKDTPFDLDDPSNINSVNGVHTIRDVVRPINVLEPVVALEGMIRRARSR